MSPSPSKNQVKRISAWLNLLLWAALALLLRWQVIEPRWIPSGSMLPTLKLQDKILIEKIRPKLTRFQGNHLKLENMVVFSPPQPLIDAGYEPNSALIKRIVGLPGDQIAVHKGQLQRNGNYVVEPWLREPIQYEMDAVEVPKNQLWVLGDNRNNSLDSHFWGPLPEENVIGTAIWRYWPMKRFGPIRFPSQ